MFKYYSEKDLKEAFDTASKQVIEYDKPITLYTMRGKPVNRHYKTMICACGCNERIEVKMRKVGGRMGGWPTNEQHAERIFKNGSHQSKHGNAIRPLMREEKLRTRRSRKAEQEKSWVQLARENLQSPVDLFLSPGLKRAQL